MNKFNIFEDLIEGQLEINSNCKVSVIVPRLISDDDYTAIEGLLDWNLQEDAGKYCVTHGAADDGPIEIKIKYDTHTVTIKESK